MYRTIIVNRRTPVNLINVSLIEPITEKDVRGMIKRYGGAESDYKAFRSAIRLIDGSTKLATQTIRDLAKLAKGRVLSMSTSPKGDGNVPAGPLVPIDAIRHLEPISDDERAAMKAAYGGTSPDAIDAKRTRIVYRALDPASPERYFQKTFQADIVDDLLDQEVGFLIDIGNGKFVLADEVSDARTLDEKETARLSRRYTLKARNGEQLITSVVLADDEFILSSLSAQAIETLVGRPLPSLHGYADEIPDQEIPADAPNDPALA